MSLLQRFKQHIQQEHLFAPRDKLLLAVSGGVDSVVLCELCKQAGFDFRLAHCNFQLRGEESERDERFVIGLGVKYEVKVEVKKFDTEQYAAENKLSVQEAARKLRYDWFAELVNGQWSMVNPQPGNDPIHHSPFTIHLLTAHHADDNTETLLMNFFRGTGLHGLTGIPSKNDPIRRPLLPFSKEELLTFARENKLDWSEDSSNESSKYTRNYFRNELIPALEKVFPQVKENLQDNINRFKEIEALYKLSVGAIKKKLGKIKGSELHLPVKQLLGYDNRALIYEVIKDYGFTEKQIDEVIKLGSSDSGKHIDAPAGDYRIIKHRHWFIFSPVKSDQSENIVIEKGLKEISFALGKLRIEETTNEKRETTNQELLDMDKIVFPLLLRKWKRGDYFYPLGMRKKKKVARLLIDLKLSATEKENTWVMESGQHIIWVVGRRIDDRFKITDRTRHSLRLTLSSP